VIWIFNLHQIRQLVLLIMILDELLLV
jgi:hypothetical protein